ncbi:spermidine synthase [Mycolicibacterium hippocampi]|uniref:Spermidine synthase n=1 Tax=Mycolicibacterium hippocampi TaxID=659824 RepID=A0A7I9ZLQ4_9MYCO|nr:spermidine synthase [Mycolicibacterium hippocampi]GFH01739.1 spermidine synthase [Mycolicibacterium hippocampi]
MSARFEELGWQQTPMGQISLRRRFDLSVRTDVYEVKIDDEYLMSSLFTVAERELARLGLQRTPGADLDVVVGGLGLGYTAQEALLCNRIRSLTVIEYSEAIIEWHQRDLLPDTVGLAADSRVTVMRADFFAAATDPKGFEPGDPGKTYDAILLDIDHSPRHVLDPAHAAFYTRDGLLAAATRLVPGGTFALWSDDPPDDDFCSTLESVFTDVEARQIWFDNPLTQGRSANTVYLANRP